MLNQYYRLGALAVLLIMSVSEAMAGGISADAGLTPGKDKYIFRSQVRWMERNNDPSMMPGKMESYMFPFVFAYGVSPKLTLMARQAVMRRDMTMSGLTSRNSGFGDPLVMAKFRALRINSPTYSWGIALLGGVEFPFGQSPFSSKGYDLKMGLYLSARRIPWAADFNLRYSLNGRFAGESVDPRNEVVSVVSALARQFSIGNDGRRTVAPVIEISYQHVSPIRLDNVRKANSGEAILQVSPGMKFTYSSIILEGLVQVPVWQNQIGNQPELEVGFLIGIRIMR